MALIGSIRKHMWLVIVLLALALAGFIIMDMTNASNRGSFGSKTVIGEVAGEKIDYMDFQRTEQALYSGSGDVYGRRNALWNYYVEKAIIDKISDKTGIAVGSDELNELEFGTNLHPMVQSFYRDPRTGQVDRKQLDDVKKAIDEGTVSNPEFAARFNELRKQVIKSQKETKLSNLVSRSLYTPTWMAEAIEKVNNETASFEYVKIPFDYIPDADVKLTDDDYAKYIKANESKYTNKEEVRNIAYLAFDVKATKDDSLNLRDEMVKLATEFRTATNDSLFTANNEGLYANRYAKKDELTGKLKDTITSVGIKGVYGPYIDNGSYVVAKLIDKKVLPDSAKASHILRAVQGNDPIQLAAARKYIDSLKNDITSGKTSFSAAATANSQDPGSATKGGDLGSFTPGTMVPEFNDAVFNGKPGSMYVVTTQFGVHLIKVEKHVFKTNEMKYNVAYINRPIIPSEATQTAMEEKVMGMLEKTKNLEDLNKLATGDMKVETAGGIKKNDYVLGALGSGQTSRDIIRWAWEEDTETGSVSPTLYTYADEANYVDSKHVIAALKSVDKAGLATVESMKSSLEARVRNEKKGEMIASRVSGTDLASIAAAFNQKVETAENVTYGSGMINNAQEPSVIGKLFALSNSGVTKPVVGKSGVYIARLISKTPATVTAGAFQTKAQQTQQDRMQVSYRLMEAIKKSKKIEDKRFTFY